MKKIVIVAGDKSGDLYGGFLCRKLNARYPGLELFSFGGPHLAQHSVQTLNLLSHPVAGLFEVACHLKDIIAMFNKAVEEINTLKPDLIILIDFPDFNLRLAKTLNKKFPILYYVSPQVWAWRKKRIELIKRYVEKMIVIFKFEEDFYRKEGMDALYFGHPLLEIIPPKLLEEKKEPKKIISFLPGSRKNEIARHLPVMQKAKRNMESKLKDYHFRIIKPLHLEDTLYKKFAPGAELIEHSYEAIAESEFIVTSSGTATVEIAILEVPFLIIYKVNPFTWYILKSMVKAECIGMVNILASKKIIKELLQNQANPKNIAKQTLQYLTDKDKYQQIQYELKKLKKVLSPHGATERLSEYIGKYLKL
ncbi:MAG: lipid-A-disaccharide synthase [Candidatus Omnitrophota bacterium]|nr:MAG: lipid-A-disaccharide synthase [Candidatus Omnitrophota bacterium]